MRCCEFHWVLQQEMRVRTWNYFGGGIGSVTARDSLEFRNDHSKLASEIYGNSTGCFELPVSNDHFLLMAYLFRCLIRLLALQLRPNDLGIKGQSAKPTVVGRLPPPKQTKESARRDKRPSPGYCVAICFYYAALGHMFVLVGCGRGARPYVSIMRRWAICLYWLAVGVGLGHMFLLCGARLYVCIGWL